MTPVVEIDHPANLDLSGWLNEPQNGQVSIGALTFLKTLTFSSGNCFVFWLQIALEITLKAAYVALLESETTFARPWQKICARSKLKEGSPIDRKRVTATLRRNYSRTGEVLAAAPQADTASECKTHAIARLILRSLYSSPFLFFHRWT